MAVHTNDVVPLLSSSFHFKFCENLSVEDNFNNTFFGKVLPHTTSVATEFRAKVRLFPERAKQNRTLLHKTNPPCLHANLYLTQRTQRTQNFQCKLRCRRSSRWLRVTEGAKETKTMTKTYCSPLCALLS